MMSGYKLIVAGGREFNDLKRAYATLDRIEAVKGLTLEIVCGGARGADAIGKRWAESRGRVIHMHLAKWDIYDEAGNWIRKDIGAGHKRNAVMAEHGDGLLAFWDKKSKGTKNMIALMMHKKKPTMVLNY